MPSPRAGGKQVVPRFEVRPGLKDLAFSEGGPKAWFVVVKRKGRSRRRGAAQLDSLLAGRDVVGRERMALGPKSVDPCLVIRPRHSFRGRLDGRRAGDVHQVDPPLLPWHFRRKFPTKKDRFAVECHQDGNGRLARASDGRGRAIACQRQAHSCWG
jgi:hypothetical protein